MGKFRAARRHPCVLVPRLPIPRRRQRNRELVLSHFDLLDPGRDHRLLQSRRKRQPHAPAVLPDVRHAALQRSRDQAASDLRSRRHVRRPRRGTPGPDDVDGQRAEVGLLRSRASAGRRTAAACRVTGALGELRDRRSLVLRGEVVGVELAITFPARCLIGGLSGGIPDVGVQAHANGPKRARMLHGGT